MRRLAEDHANAEALAAGLRGLGFETEAPQTNIVYIDVAPAEVEPLRVHLESRGILATVKPRMRLVTHLDLPVEKVRAALTAFGDFSRRAA